MSDYKRGKVCVYLWAGHWEAVAEMADSGSTIEADLVDYGVAIRHAFQHGTTPNVLLMTPRLKETHRTIMMLPVDDRETIITWHFGDDEERESAFGSPTREPEKMKSIYRKIGRKMGS